MKARCPHRSCSDCHSGFGPRHPTVTHEDFGVRALPSSTQWKPACRDVNRRQGPTSSPPAPEAQARSASHKRLGPEAPYVLWGDPRLRMNDALSRSHQIDGSWLNDLYAYLKAVTMLDRPIKKIGDGRKVDVRMGPNIASLTAREAGPVPTRRQK